MYEDICFRNGMSGRCGVLCEAFYQGYCENPFEFSYTYLIENGFDEEEIEEIANFYFDYFEDDRFLKENDFKI